MSIKALITAALLFGTTTAAMAAPRAYSSESRDHRTTTVAFQQPIVRDHRTEWQSRSAHSAELTSTRPFEDENPSSYSNGFVTVGTFNAAFDGSRTVDLGCGRYINNLRITSADGNSEVYSVVVRFADGQSQTYSWNHIFASASDGQAGPYLQMGIGGRMVTSVQVNARSSTPRSMSVQIA